MKKAIIVAIAAGVLVVPASMNVFAAEKTVGKSEIVTADSTITEGFVADENNSGNKPQLYAGVTSGKADGGYWIRGKRDGNVISEYKHYTKQGRATVTNGKGVYNDGKWQKKDVFSKAKATWTSSGTNKANYDNK